MPGSPSRPSCGRPWQARALEANPPPYVHNGEPFFPIGLWSYPPGGDFDTCRAEIASAGFNIMHRWYSTVTTATLDADHSVGLNAICWAYKWLGDPVTYGTAIEAKIAEVGNHPAFFAWSTRDEPYWAYSMNPTGCGFTREGLTAGKEFVNLRDPTHRVICNFAPYDLVIGQCTPPITFEGFQLWTSVGNVFSMDRYPADGNYPNTDLTPVAYCCDRLYEIIGEGVPMHVILQGCGLGEWNGVPNPSSRPNRVEDRFMVYSAIIHGARGVLYYGTNHIEPESQMWADIKSVAGEIHALHDVLCKGTTSAGHQVQNADCQAIMKLYGGYRYLIVDNAGSSPQSDVAISIPAWHSSSVKVLFENRTLSTAMGHFSDDFVPWDSHVYKIPFQTAWVDLGATNQEQGLVHILAGVPDGDTEPVTVGGREARESVDPATDFYFYFDVSDALSHEASRSELYVTIDYYDTGAGSLGLEYDSDTGSDLAAIYKSGGSVPLTGSLTWKQHMFHVSDAYFGGRQNGGADFRIARYGGATGCLDVVGVSTESPLPAAVQNAEPLPGAADVDRNADLTWTAPERATAYLVYFGTSSPLPLRASQTATAFDPGAMTYFTRYYWRIDAVNGFGTTPGEERSFTTRPYPGDHNADGDVDQEDFGHFQACYSGSAHGYGSGCGHADLDSDLDVDSSDFDIFLSCMSGPGQHPACE